MWQCCRSAPLRSNCTRRSREQPAVWFFICSNIFYFIFPRTHGNETKVGSRVKTVTYCHSSSRSECDHMFPFFVIPTWCSGKLCLSSFLSVISRTRVQFLIVMTKRKKKRWSLKHCFLSSVGGRVRSVWLRFNPTLRNPEASHTVRSPDRLCPYQARPALRVSLELTKVSGDEVLEVLEDEVLDSKSRRQVCTKPYVLQAVMTWFKLSQSLSKPL